MNLELHFIPGLFAAGGRSLLKALEEGAGGLKLGKPLPDALSSGNHKELFAYLRAVPEGEVREGVLQGSCLGHGALHLHVQVYGCGPAGRFFPGLKLTGKSGGSLKDLELALLGLACGALSGESQGAALIGWDLGPIGVGLCLGTISEQVRSLLEVLQHRVLTLLVASDTARSLGDLAGYTQIPFGDHRQFIKLEPDSPLPYDRPSA